MDANIRTITYTNKPFIFSYFISEIWRNKFLIWVFTKRDLKVKYAQTMIGVGWTLIQPLTAALIYSILFGEILGWKVDGMNYTIYVLSGLIGWNFFSYLISSGSTGIQEANQLITKIYFPKAIIPLSKMLFAMIELCMNLVVLILLVLYYKQPISWHVIFLPLVLLFNAICGLTVVFWLSAFATKKRDILHLIPFIIQFGIWLTPVFYIESIMHLKYAVFKFNPMSNVIEFWRWSMFGLGDFKWIWIINCLIVTFLFLLGMFVFSKKEHQISDNA